MNLVLNQKTEQYKGQKNRARNNRTKILLKLALKRLTFNELSKSVRISAPTLSDHLKKLEQQGIVIRVVEYDKKGKSRVVIKLTEKGFKVQEIKNLIFEFKTYHKILWELAETGEAIRFSTEEEKMGEHESMISWGLSPEFLEKKSEIKIVKALDKWLSPITLFSIVQELKGKTRFTEAIQGLLEKLSDVVKQKDLSKIEDALKTLYPSQFEALENIVVQVENQKMVFDLFDQNFREHKLSLEG